MHVNVHSRDLSENSAHVRAIVTRPSIKGLGTRLGGTYGIPYSTGIALQPPLFYGVIESPDHSLYIRGFVWGRFSLHSFTLFLQASFFFLLEASDLGVRIGTIYVGSPTFADDMALIASSQEDLQGMLSVVDIIMPVSGGIELTPPNQLF